MSETLIYDKDYANKRVTMTFNRPQAMNSINPELSDAFRAAVEDFDNDPGLWVAILTGRATGPSAPAPT